MSIRHFKIRLIIRLINSSTSWTQNVNWTYMRYLEGILDVSQTSYVRSVYHADDQFLASDVFLWLTLASHVWVILIIPYCILIFFASQLSYILLFCLQFFSCSFMPLQWLLSLVLSESQLNEKSPNNYLLIYCVVLGLVLVICTLLTD